MNGLASRSTDITGGLDRLACVARLTPGLVIMRLAALRLPMRIFAPTGARALVKSAAAA
ncbi:hypothetical protein [Mesorhizobium sp. INR15]|uniref:hypothetical protein n=1 Tax=Mesorhizobium sp. INR15 TaxID=2654248 RepID=UPI0018967F92|nr:hypothetical protein [Mesorhizobium sp. INR15]